MHLNRTMGSCLLSPISGWRERGHKLCQVNLAPKKTRQAQIRCHVLGFPKHNQGTSFLT